MKHINTTIDCAEPQKLAAWWIEAMGGGSVKMDLGEFVFVALDGVPAGVGFQKVAEPRGAKNRVHLDFGSPDRVAEVERLVAMGAQRVEDHTIGGGTWTVMRDIEGNEFCVVDQQ